MLLTLVRLQAILAVPTSSPCHSRCQYIRLYFQLFSTNEYILIFTGWIEIICRRSYPTTLGCRTLCRRRQWYRNSEQEDPQWRDCSIQLYPWYVNCASNVFSIMGCSTRFIVVGQDELDSRSVNVRNRDDVGTKARSEIIKLDEVLEKMLSLKNERRLENRFK